VRVAGGAVVFEVAVLASGRQPRPHREDARVEHRIEFTRLVRSEVEPGLGQADEFVGGPRENPENHRKSAEFDFAPADRFERQVDARGDQRRRFAPPTAQARALAMPIMVEDEQGPRHAAGDDSERELGCNVAKQPCDLPDDLMHVDFFGNFFQMKLAVS